MSKKEQEAKIQALRDLEKQFATGQNVGSSVVPCKSKPIFFPSHIYLKSNLLYSSTDAISIAVEQSESSDDEEDSESEEE